MFNKLYPKLKGNLAKLTSITRVSLLIVVTITPSLAIPRKAPLLIKDSPKEVIDQVWQIIYRDYLDANGKYDQSDWLVLRKKLLSNKYHEPSDAHEAIKGMLSSLDDPYTRFLDPKDFHEMRIDTSGELTGIGIQLSLDTKTNNLVVISPIEGTPAFNAGIKPNDIIISIDGKDATGMDIDSAVKLIRGKKGTSVTLGILRGEQSLEIPLIRTRIEIRSVISRINSTQDNIKIGYIRLKQFNANASKEMRDAIIDLEKKNPSGYVLDLRGNPGGLLEASIQIARHWIDDGIIVSTKTRGGINDVRRANGNALTDKPMVVLVNEASASASEIVAGAIQDNKRGLLVGKKTFGKGLVQSVRPLADGSGITVTVAKYLTPNGTDINKHGIKPNIESPMNLNRRIYSYDLGTKSDSQYVSGEKTLIKEIRLELNKILSFRTKEDYSYKL